MKPRTYFGLALLFPYILWVIFLVVYLIFTTMNIIEAWNMVMMPIIFYLFGIVVWFFPYSILAIVLWIGSRYKSAKTLYRLALIAPLLLFILMLIEVVVIYQPVVGVAELMEALPGQAALLGGFSLVFGYLCVGIALGLFRYLKSRNRILEETVPSQQTD